MTSSRVSEVFSALSLHTMPKGSWKWQDAYGVGRYQPRLTRDGRWIWVKVGQYIGKSSLPQIRRRCPQAETSRVGHNVEMTPAEQAACTFIAAGLL